MLQEVEAVGGKKKEAEQAAAALATSQFVKVGAACDTASRVSPSVMLFLWLL